MNLESEYKKEIGKQAYDKVLEKYSLGYVDWLEEKLKEQLKTNIMKASNLVFPEELITRVKKNWLTTLNYLTVGKTDNELSGIYRAGKIIIRIHQPYKCLYKVINKAERTCLTAITINRDVMPLQCLHYKI